MGGERERETATQRGRALCDLPLGELIQSTVELRCEYAYGIALDYRERERERERDGKRERERERERERGS